MDAQTRVEELRAAVHADPGQVAEAAARLAVRARADGDPAMLSRVLAVLGRARRALGAIELAEADLVAAIAAGNEAGDPELAADGHLGLAGVYAFTGRTAQALAHLDSLQRLGSPRLRAYGSLQRAALQQRIGNRREALAGYERALPTLRELDARVDIALVLMNRGVIRSQLGDCDAAIVDLTEAGRLFAEGSNGYAHAQTLHGLGWAYAHKGELATALRYLDEATDRFRELGHTAPEVEVDRCEVLLAAGLSGQAAEAARDVAGRLDAAGNQWQVAQAWLLCARASLADGDPDAAARYARLAGSMFAEHGSAAWERSARLEVIRARLASGRVVDVGELRDLAGALDAAGSVRGAATALSLACVAAAGSGAVELATSLAGECRRRAARLGVFEVRMQARYAAACCAGARGDDVAARRHVRNALADLRRHRASIAVPDAQAAVAVHAGQLAALGLRLALRTGRPAVVLDWMERIREAGPGRPAARPPEDAELAAALRQLRSVAALVRSAEVDGHDTVDLLRRQRDLERLIHRRRLGSTPQRPGTDEVAPPGVARLRAVLGGASLVELADIDDRLVGVAVAEGVRLADLGPAAAARDAVAACASAMRSLVTTPSSRPGGAARLGLLRRATGALDAMLAPLVTGAGPVVLVVPAALHAAPWQLLPSLAGRPVTVAPSATWWYRTETADGPRGTAAARATVVAGPRLAVADDEAGDVAACYPGATLLTGPAATGAAVSTAMAGATLAHIACHGRIRDDNALWSSLELFDGPLYLYDLERLGRTPPLVVLSGCETGVGVRVGDQLIGLSSVLLGSGTLSLVASRCPVPDSDATREAMTALHRQIAVGASPAGVLARLSTGWSDGDPVALVAAALGCFGTHRPFGPANP